PQLTKRAQQGEANTTFELALALVMAFYLPIAVGAPFAARWLVVTLFSSQYAPAVPAAIWLANAAVLYAVAHLARSGSIAIGKRHQITVAAGITLALNLGLNAFVIPRYGFVGAAAVTFFTELLEAVVLLRLFMTGAGPLRWRGTFLIPVVSAAA